MSNQTEDPKIAQFRPKKIENTNLDSKGVDVKAFRPQSFKQGVANDYQQVKSKFGSFATTDSNSNSNFKLQGETSRLLGVDDEEKGRIAELVKAEVSLQVQKVQDAAYLEGMNQGLLEGKEQARIDFLKVNQPVFEKFCELTQNLENLKSEMFVANERLLVNIMFQIAKQILLRELKTDTGYIKRLTAQIVEQIGAKDHVRIKLSQEDYQSMESTRDFLKGHFPDLRNIQFEISDQIEMGGCRVETDLSRIDASVETQLIAIESSLGKP